MCLAGELNPESKTGFAARFFALFGEEIFSDGRFARQPGFQQVHQVIQQALSKGVCADVRFARTQSLGGFSQAEDDLPGEQMIDRAEQLRGKLADRHDAARSDWEAFQAARRRGERWPPADDQEAAS